MVKSWCKKTPNHFRFTAKFPKVITHDKRLKDIEKELELFFSSMIYLEDKILALLIQLPPSIKIVEGTNHFEGYHTHTCILAIIVIILLLPPVIYQIYIRAIIAWFVRPMHRYSLHVSAKSTCYHITISLTTFRINSSYNSR